MLNIKKKISFLFIVYLFVLGSYNNLIDVKAFENKEEIDLLLNEDTNIQEIIKEIKEVDPVVQITEFEEVSLLHLELSKPGYLDNILNDESIINQVEQIGTMPDIEIGRTDLGSIYSGEKIVGGEKLYNNSRKRMTNETIFDLMGWHVDEVTDKRYQQEKM